MSFVEGGERRRETSICLKALHKSSEDHKAGLTYIVLKKIKEHA